MSKLSGRTYNATGDGDSEMDAATIYANVMRAVNAASGSREQWKLISIVCFIEPDIDGEYFSEMDYRALYQMAPNIQSAFEAADAAFADARTELRRKLDGEAGAA
jgi:hypothetical protein